ncbi:hypothetical protein [Methylocapsa aurea]|uniref:hypothetical protein n=1 Tax=Methylocapsa aurea TaxID=663610 RepID=UPI003D18A681
MVLSLALSSLSYNLPTVPSVERRPTSPEVAASSTQTAPRAANIDASKTDTGNGRKTSAETDVSAQKDPYAQIDALLASLRDLTLGGAKLDSASTTSQANAAYSAYARD